MCCALLTDVQPCALPVCFELPVTMGGSSGYINGHVAACLPNFMIMEVGEGEIEDGVYNTDIKFEDGYAVLGERPGTGGQSDYEGTERAVARGVGKECVRASRHRGARVKYKQKEKK